MQRQSIKTMVLLSQKKTSQNAKNKIVFKLQIFIFDLNI